MTTNKKMNFWGFFTLTAAMLMSADEYPAFAQSGLLAVVYLFLAGLIWFLPVALCAAELATIDGNNEGGVYTWVKNVLGARWGFVAVFFQWLQITVNFITMIYFIIGSLSYVLKWDALNTNPWLKWLCFLLIYWGMTAWQLGGVSNTEKIVNISFTIGIVFPSLVLLVLGLIYLLGSGQMAFNTNWASNWQTLTQHFSIATIVPYILAFTGIEASAAYITDLKNPRKNYPLELLTLVIFAIVFDSLGGLSVAAVVPVANLTLNQGVIQAVGQMFARTIPLLHWGVNVIGLLMVLGMVGEISSWIIGPVKSLFVTAEDGILPHYFLHVNRHDVPVRLILVQGLIVSVISFLLTVVFGGNNGAYQMAMSLTVMLYLVTYILIFVAYLRQIKQKNKPERTFKVPGGKIGQTLVATIGLISSLIVVGSTFMPGSNFTAISKLSYLLIMIAFLVVILAITLLIYHLGTQRPKKTDYNWKIRHRKVEDVQRTVFPQGRYQHELKYIEKSLDDEKQKVTHYFSPNSKRNE